MSKQQQQQAELSLQLQETHREADQYHRTNIEQLAQINQLSMQLSTIKMELAEKRPGVNFGAQVFINIYVKNNLIYCSKYL